MLQKGPSVLLVTRAATWTTWEKAKPSEGCKESDARGVSIGAGLNMLVTFYTRADSEIYGWSGGWLRP